MLKTRAIRLYIATLRNRLLANNEVAIVIVPKFPKSDSIVCFG